MPQTELTPAAACLMESRPVPCALVIFGASGDLTARMVFPALAKLHGLGAMPERFAIVGASRTHLDHEAFRDKMRQALEAAGIFDPALWEEMASRLFYQVVDYADPAAYADLGKTLADLDGRLGLGGKLLFYLAIPPELFEPVVRGLGQAGLTGKGRPGPGSRIVVEKPFGHDLESARRLSDILGEWFDEGHICRIDHYLAKETIQNVLLFRFANAVFEPIWNRRYIESVSILSTETLGVEHRAGFYERSGVLRDMFQNHMMQLLALVAMEAPPVFEANVVGDEKVKLYRSLRPFDPERRDRDLVLGQYGPGTVGGREVGGYRGERGVAPDSMTPTFAMLRTYVDNWRWQGVPFYLCSGKRLARKLTRMVIHFKTVPHSMFRGVLGEGVSANRLVLDAHPDQAISLSFQAKRPGGKLCLRPASMRFDFTADDYGPPLDAYEKVLLDCMLGESMLFARRDAVELSWGYFTPILEVCEACADKGAMLKTYPAGSWGPPEAVGVNWGFVEDTE